MSGPTDEPAVSSDDVAYRDLVTRLLSMRAGRDPDLSPPEVLPGMLPPSFGVALPSLPGARLVGSLVEGPQVTLVYDSPRTKEETSFAYYDALIAAGWRESQRMGHRMGGLRQRTTGRDGTPPAREHAKWGHLQFVRAESEPLLDINVAPGPEEGHATLEVRVDSDPDSSMRRFMRTQDNTGETPILPDLTPPPGVRYQPYGASTNDMGSSSFGVLMAPGQTLAGVAEHYQRQLERAGWHQDAGGVEPLAAWNIWTFTRDEQPWRGVLMLALLTEQPDLRATIDVRAEYIGDPAYSPQRRHARGGSSSQGYRLLAGGWSVASTVQTSGIQFGPVTSGTSDGAPPTPPQEGGNDATGTHQSEPKPPASE